MIPDKKNHAIPWVSLCFVLTWDAPPLYEQSLIGTVLPPPFIILTKYWKYRGGHPKV